MLSFNIKTCWLQYGRNFGTSLSFLVSVYFLFGVNTSASGCLERLIEMTYYMLNGILILCSSNGLL